MSGDDAHEPNASPAAPAQSAGQPPARETILPKAKAEDCAKILAAGNWWWLPILFAVLSMLTAVIADSTEWMSWDAAFFWGYALGAVPALLLEGRHFARLLAGAGLDVWSNRAEAIALADRVSWNRAVEQVQLETAACIASAWGRYFWAASGLSLAGLVISLIRLAHVGRGASFGEFLGAWVAACVAAVVTVPGTGVLLTWAKKGLIRATATLCKAVPPSLEGPARIPPPNVRDKKPQKPNEGLSLPQPQPGTEPIVDPGEGTGLPVVGGDVKQKEPEQDLGGFEPTPPRTPFVLDSQKEAENPE
jgi:hypothetical protein